jgi:dTDP-4-amino-4,6-dideoxygalactose transaminase
VERSGARVRRHRARHVQHGPTRRRAGGAALGPSLIIATHVFGNPADAGSLGNLAARCSARLLFDAAHGYGSRRGDTPVGGLGDVEVFSLSGTKPVTCAEGGLVASRNPEFLQRLEYARAYGFQHDYKQPLPRHERQDVGAALSTRHADPADDRAGARTPLHAG